MRESTNIKAPENSQPAGTTGVNQAEFLEISPSEINPNENLDLEDSNQFIEKVSLMDLIQQETRNSLVEWAESSGLINTTTSDNVNTTTSDNSEAGFSKDPVTINNNDGQGSETSQPLAFVSDALNERPGSNLRLLETLILGGGMLYGLNRATNNGASKWFKRLLPATPRTFLIGGFYRQVITVFKSENNQGLNQIVAARISDEQIEILAEQQFPMSLEAASAQGNIDLKQELEKLVKKVSDESSRRGDLLLYDPRLKNELKVYEDLGRKNDELKPQQLRRILSRLDESETTALQQWLKAPSKLKHDVHPIKDHLRKRQKQLRKMLSHEKSVLVSVLELSLAMDGI